MSESFSSVATSAPPPSPRRNDLDALRAVAMLLGIGLHAALSFIPGVWPVQDSLHNDSFTLFFSAVHGFRMPLFFLISGFFTAMLWRKRGLSALLKHRFKRIFIPCMIGLVTIVPALNWSIGKGISTGAGTGAEPAADIWAAAAVGDHDAVERELTKGVDINGHQPGVETGPTPVTIAAIYGQTATVALLLEKGADANGRNKDGGSPLHAAAFFGRAESARLLLEEGADPKARDAKNQRPQDLLSLDWKITEFIGSLLQLELDREEVEAGRAEVARLLVEHDATIDTASSGSDKGSGIGGRLAGWFITPVFHHLWFLWFLCWLVPGFALCAALADKLGWRSPPKWLTLSPIRFLWLIPLTLIPQFLMGWTAPVFGPDTSAGLLPLPHVLFYYAIFFGFGALYFLSDDESGRVGKWWAVTLPLALLLVFPIGLALTHGGPEVRARAGDAATRHVIASVLKVSYAWMMSFAFMGMFRRLLSRESRAMRYISDSSYWLYVAHLPLVILAQIAVRDWQISAVLKFTIICVWVTGVLLAVYQFMVRYTWVGRLLNGPRRRPSANLTRAGEIEN